MDFNVGPIPSGDLSVKYIISFVRFQFIKAAS